MIIVGLLTFVVTSAAAAFYGAIYMLSHKPRAARASEKTYISASDNTPKDLPSINDPATVKLSVVIPCYNEAKRLGYMLDEAVPYLQEHYPGTWEIVLVNDGSTDNTVDVALQWARDNHLKGDDLRISQLVKNRGKGGAVTHGMQHTRGEMILFADADGASTFSDVKKLVAAVRNAPRKRAVAVGSRAHMLNTDAVVKRTYVRNFLMYGLHTLLYVFGIRSIHDTQCGFKLFTRQAAADIFPFMHTEGWIFDVEALLIALRKKIPLHEIAISWHEVEGSKIDLARDSVLMALDLVVIRFAYLMGIYTDKAGSCGPKDGSKKIKKS